MNNIKKAFKTKSMLRQYANGGEMDYSNPSGKMRGGKSSLRCMADGGGTDPRVLGQGGAAAAGALIAQAPRNLDAAIEAQSQGNAYTGQAPSNNAAVQQVVPAQQGAQQDDTPKMSWWHKYFGLADGGMPLDDLSPGARTGTGRAQYNRAVRGMSDETMTGVLDQEDRGRSPAFINRGSRLRGPFGLADGGQATDPAYDFGKRVGAFADRGIDAVSRGIIEPVMNQVHQAGADISAFGRGFNRAPAAAAPPKYSDADAQRELNSTLADLNNPNSPNHPTPSPTGTIFAGTGKFGERAFTDQHGIGDIASGAHAYTPGQGIGSFNVIHNDNPIASPTQPNPTGLAAQFAALNKTIQGLGNNTAQGVVAPAYDPKNVGKGGQFSNAQRASFANQTLAANNAAAQNQSTALSALRPQTQPQQGDSDYPGYADGGRMPPARDEGYIDTNHPQIQMARGGVVKGPGGPTDDAVGPVMLSKGEYVLPADTVKHVGKQNLDNLRAKTHKFVGPRHGLRGMADGGVEFDPHPQQMGFQFGALPEGPAPMNPAQPTVGTTFQTQGGQRVELPNPRAQVTPPPAASNVDPRQLNLGALPQRAVAAEEAAPGVDAAAMRVGLRGMAGRALGGAAGAGMGLYDMSQNGVTPGNAATTAGGALFAVPHPYAKVLGGALMGGGMLYDALKNTDPGPDTTPPPVPRGTQAPAASEPARAAALSTQQEDPDLAALRQGFQSLGTQQPVNMPRVYSNADAINSHYDALSKELHKLYTPKGAGNLALRLLSLEDARARALGQDQGNMASMYGHGVTQQQIGQQARELGLRGLGELYQKNIDRQIGMRNFQLEMAKLGRGYEEEGAKDVDKQVGDMFTTSDGKPDLEKSTDYKNFLEASALKQHGQSLYSMPADQRRLFTQQQLPLYNMLTQRNAAASAPVFGKGVQSRAADLPVDVAPSTLNDVMNHHLSLGSYIKERLPFTNPNVVHTQSGQAVPLSMIGVDPSSGQYDAQQLQAIGQMTGQDMSKYVRGLRRNSGE